MTLWGVAAASAWAAEVAATAWTGAAIAATTAAAAITTPMLVVLGLTQSSPGIRMTGRSLSKPNQFV
jgi:hypothetical protein